MMKVAVVTILLGLSNAKVATTTKMTNKKKSQHHENVGEDMRDRCTAIGVGPKAMADGSTVTTHSKYLILNGLKFHLYVTNTYICIYR
jgi:hypothetical protein